MQLNFLNFMLLLSTTNGHISFLPAFFGGGDYSSSHERGLDDENNNVIQQHQQQQHQPLAYFPYRYHRYHPSYFQNPNPNRNLNLNRIIKLPYPVVVSTSTAPTITATEELPLDLQNLAMKLGFEQRSEIPSLAEVTKIIGFTSGTETIDFLRDLASTEQGIELIRAFIKPEETAAADDDDENNEVAAAESIPVPSVLTPPQVSGGGGGGELTSPTGNRRYDNLVRNSKIDLEILNKAIQRPGTTTTEMPGIMQRFRSWATSFVESAPSAADSIPEGQSAIKLAHESSHESNVANDASRSQLIPNPKFSNPVQYFRAADGKLYAIVPKLQGYNPTKYVAQVETRTGPELIPEEPLLPQESERIESVELPPVETPSPIALEKNDNEKVIQLLKKNLMTRPPPLMIQKPSMDDEESGIAKFQPKQYIGAEIAAIDDDEQNEIEHEFDGSRTTTEVLPFFTTTNIEEVKIAGGEAEEGSTEIPRLRTDEGNNEATEENEIIKLHTDENLITDETTQLPPQQSIPQNSLNYNFLPYDETSADLPSKIEINSLSSAVLQKNGITKIQDTVGKWKPQRGAGYQAYGTGRVHRADPLSIDIPKKLLITDGRARIFNNNNSKPIDKMVK